MTRGHFGAYIAGRLRSFMNSPSMVVQTAYFASLVSGLALSKWIAVYSGVETLGYQGALLSGAALAGGLAIVGLEAAIPLIGADHRFSGRATAMAATLILTTTSPLLIVTSTILAFAVFSEVAPALAIVSSSIAALSWLGARIRVALASVFGSSRLVGIQVLTPSAVGALATAALLWYMPPTGSLLALALGPAIGLTCALAIPVLRPESRDATGGRSVVRLAASRLLQLGWPRYLASMVSLLGHTSIPIVITLLAGVYATGLYRSAYVVAFAIPGAVLSAMGASHFPRMAKQARNTHARRLTVMRETRRVLALLLPVGGTLAITAPFALRLAFSVDFMVAAPLLCIFIIGGTFQVLYAVNEFSIMALGRLRLQMAIQSTTMLIIVAGTLVAANFDSLAGFGYASATGWFMALAVSELSLARSGIGVLRSAGRNLRILLLVCVMATAIMAVWWSLPTSI